MRRCTHDTEVLYTGINDSFIGINLGWDFTSEHEWGIQELNDLFQINKQTLEIERFPSPNIHLHKIKDNYYLHAGKWLSPQYCNQTNEVSPEIRLLNKKIDMVCAWSESDFGIHTTSKYEKEMNELYDAFIKCDIIMGFDPKPTFLGNRGLYILIKSRIANLKLSDITSAKNY